VAVLHQQIQISPSTHRSVVLSKHPTALIYRIKENKLLAAEIHKIPFSKKKSSRNPWKNGGGGGGTQID
jgi:hypothetical protein